MVVRLGSNEDVKGSTVSANDKLQGGLDEGMGERLGRLEAGRPEHYSPGCIRLCPFAEGH